MASPSTTAFPLNTCHLPFSMAKELKRALETRSVNYERRIT
jgi:hypothetical protein